MRPRAARLSIRLLSLVPLAMAGCGGLDRDVSRFVTIAQGVYGQVVSGTDASGGSDDGYYVGLKVTLFPTGSRSQEIGSAVTDARGFYEIAADASDVQICGALQGSDWCQTITVPVGVRRVDGIVTAGLFWH